jgi:hypothetical protein
MEIGAGVDLKIGEIYYLHYNAGDWGKNWYKILILSKEPDGKWLFYYLGVKKMGATYRRFGSESTNGAYDLYKTTPANEDDTNLTSLS